MPPLRSVTSCSPSASARTVTAHSLNAIGIGRIGLVGERRGTVYLGLPARKHEAGAHHALPRPTPASGTVTYYAQSREIAKLAWKYATISKCRCVSKGRWRPSRRSSRAVAGQSLDHFEHRGEVLLAEAAADPGAVELAGEARERERGARAARLLQAQVDVLEHVLELEQHGDLVVHHRPALELAHRRVGRAARHDVQQRVEVHPDPAPDRDRLRQRGAVDGGHALR